MARVQRPDMDSYDQFFGYYGVDHGTLDIIQKEWPQLYKSYQCLIYRCHNPNFPDYYMNGAIGVKSDFESINDYIDFAVHTLHWVPGKYIIRRNTTGDFTPANLYLADKIHNSKMTVERRRQRRVKFPVVIPTVNPLTKVQSDLTFNSWEEIADHFHLSLTTLKKWCGCTGFHSGILHAIRCRRKPTSTPRMTRDAARPTPHEALAKTINTITVAQ